MFANMGSSGGGGGGGAGGKASGGQGGMSPLAGGTGGPPPGAPQGSFGAPIQPNSAGFGVDHNQATPSGGMGMFSAPQNPAQHTPAWAQQAPPGSPAVTADTFGANPAQNAAVYAQHGTLMANNMQPGYSQQQAPQQQYGGLLQMLQQYMQPQQGGLAAGVDPRVASFNQASQQPYVDPYAGLSTTNFGS